MKGTKGHWDAATNERAIRMLTGKRPAVRPGTPLVFEVTSEDGGRAYKVVHDDSGWACDCEAWEDRRTPCKHIVAVVLWLDPNPPPVEDLAVPKPPRQRYEKFDQAAYDRAQQVEHVVFDRLLWDLTGVVPERVCETGKRGRPAIPLRTQILMTVRGAHLQQSLRRGRGLQIALNQDGKGMLSRVPNYAVPSRFLNRPQAAEILLGLIEASALLVKDLEEAEPVAVDSTGFATRWFGSYLSEAHHLDRRHSWVKCHVLVGVRSKLVLTLRLTDASGADAPQFIDLIQRTRQLGYNPIRVVADMAYNGRAQNQAAEDLGMDPYIPFRSGTRGLSKGCPAWSRKFHEFHARRPEWDAYYHKRSNVEATFSAIKRLLGENLRSQNEGARFCELLARILAYNIGQVVKLAALHKIPFEEFGYGSRRPGSVPRRGSPGIVTRTRGAPPDSAAAAILAPA